MTHNEEPDDEQRVHAFAGLWDQARWIGSIRAFRTHRDARFRVDKGLGPVDDASVRTLVKGNGADGA